jgi:murein DD-endopeptidase MepM/ murein hydrolase activator NlpD
LGALQLGLFSGVGNIAPSLVATTADRALSNGLVGGITSVASGGNFGSGFLAAGVGSLAAADFGKSFGIGRLAVSASLSGAASVLGGGKFANGAVTGAFAYAASASYGAGAQDAIGGDGAPSWRFTRDASGNLVYTNEPYGGPFSSCDDCLHVSDPYGAPRDNGQTLHGVIDLSTSGLKGIEALSLTRGTVTQIGAAGFGPNSVTILSQDGIYFTYGHLATHDVNIGDIVIGGSRLGEIGTMGNSTGIHEHIQASTGSAWPPSSRMLGIHFP